jgi:CCR4-NOT transcription complex subunit 7/8
MHKQRQSYRRGDGHGRIVDVWNYNLNTEIDHVLSLLSSSRFNCIAIDTEFPGFVFRPEYTSSEANYQSIKQNVSSLKLIQLGICITDEHGIPPRYGNYCWQFNFQFDLDSDLYAENSIRLLRDNGMDFQRHKYQGIDHELFADLFVNMRVLFNKRIKWLCFHGAYDFAYLMKLCSKLSVLPDTDIEFLTLLYCHFPNIYDVKYIAKAIGGIGLWRDGSLNHLAAELGLHRLSGLNHQAGSDSMLTSNVIFRLIQLSSVCLEDRNYIGILYGLGKGYEHPILCGCWRPTLPAGSIIDASKEQHIYQTTKQIQ